MQPLHTPHPDRTVATVNLAEDVTSSLMQLGQFSTTLLIYNQADGKAVPSAWWWLYNDMVM